MYMVYKGQCKVCSQKINIVSKKELEFERNFPKSKPLTFKGNFKDPIRGLKDKMIINEKVSAPSLKEEDRSILNTKFNRDFKGRKIENHEIYKDMMIFFKLLPNDLFGGRVLVTKNQIVENEGSDEESHEPSQLAVIADS